MAHSNNPEHQLDEAKDIVINAIGETMDLYGINRSVGNLFGTMLFEDSMTLDEMREQLQMSKPSMSAGVKRLQEFDIVKQQFTRGSRKQHFIAEKDFFNFFSNFFTRKWSREIVINAEAVHDAVAILNKIINDESTDAAIKTEANETKQQLIDTLPYYEWLDHLSDALESGEIFKYFPIPENNYKED
ncbi:GbsR/MarR family transcriptional regulator [Staphylococcus saprophyticus]|uniref:choline uptake/conversion transcriptional regulator CudC n=1 Tax=Staphylococcus TaxID=1279 RepID=UPI00198139EB|nr:GbsR/MarR family transcriptional regulator [Staphylococcus saprophyticus]MBN6091541.1 GbsR/MarR family transcriptional regulator [Staphylococcus saprophyticus]MDW4225055.1 GbsR/MarR family transcriptional regulator [Staphylococcus saprophyticus]MDW4230238.1 GbsR/MarR family transcriptional regulator [Staphylococcus saprophyticus]MDW4244670.1 GbsR/MarR family transcriptional regulator [Staphylococcus saprophyticus]MDW4256995.1 GbsR/MarR family transcriptional regulator [Staphylococcus saprop